MDCKKQASKNIIDRLTWHTAIKDQAGIAKELADGQPVQEVYGLGEAGLFDDFFCFLEELGFTSLFAKIQLKVKKRESPVPFLSIFFIYLMRVVAGLKYFAHIDPVLLHSQSLMRLIGFNGREVREGTCKRGVKDTNDDRDTVRGPVCPEFIADFMLRIAAGPLEKLFNGCIGLLAKNNFFPKKIEALLDASEIESTEQCRGRGMVTKEKPPELRRRRKRIRKVLETVFGFKIWVVWDPNSGLPLAMRFANINISDIRLARAVIQQAMDNISPYAQIFSIAMDRGFMDGALLWRLQTEGIIFYIPAKSNMHVYTDALSIADRLPGVQKNVERVHGAGKNKKTIIEQYDLVGVENLTTAGFYGPAGSGSHENRKDFQPNPINAVVVRNDPYREKNPNEKILVILTNGPVTDPFVVYDGYDARSEIENSLFREAKQAWFIERPPQNSKAGFRVHVYLTILTMALTTAFRCWMVQQEELEMEGQETGIRKFREKVREENGNKLIVFHDDRYAIFEAYEVLILSGAKVLQPRGVPETITKEDILHKYGAALE